MVGSDEIEAIAIGAVLTAALLFGAVYALRRNRMRRATKGTPPTPQVASDRAYNRLAMARKEASLLESQGVDVGRPRELIGLADRSFQTREFDRAFELAQSAHEALVALRRAPASVAPRDSEPPAATAPLARSGGANGGSPSNVSATPVVAASAKIPKNKLEAQFQLHLFETEVANRPAAPTVDAARAFYADAQAATAREDYTESLRLALKARRQLGGAIESLGRPATSTAAADQAAPADRTASVERCAQCGHPIVTGDAFCRGCGAPRSGPMKCPKCGAARTPADAFCGKCGTRYA